MVWWCDIDQWLTQSKASSGNYMDRRLPEIQIEITERWEDCKWYDRPAMDFYWSASVELGFTGSRASMKGFSPLHRVFRSCTAPALQPTTVLLTSYPLFLNIENGRRVSGGWQENNCILCAALIFSQFQEINLGFSLISQGLYWLPNCLLSHWRDSYLYFSGHCLAVHLLWN